ncbi:MAG: DEAD/DEAH box helicase family protein [Nitrosomonas sp.]|uniref:type III restriction-modification system endonuclease n=2 Tax=Bacteria TaxID=2 RepID=UPI002715FA54|nr:MULTISPECIES: DEAD/DEAH box helicase family protein [Bacteria]MDO8995746.1 DEAD/DEAH box helicase family protein [Sediminibacterium sp.]MDP3664447.1 DEAD/DEAH box helicase family protein [Nitrosomonas sp.]MDZ4104730.1 DEAD/DEAH box helicase family protein [Nitrosomonas sp.]
MKLKFKKQQYQTNAVESVADCFAGQPNNSGIQYRIDPGRVSAGSLQQSDWLDGAGFKNMDIALLKGTLLENIHKVQQRQNLSLSTALVSNKVCEVNLDVEMETGTGKTYCYVKTMFELNQRYGWSKFIVVVPSIAIREGVFKTLEITAEHFLEEYGKRARFFIYNSKQLHNLESFSSDAGVNVMVINVQAFNATGKDARRINEELDDFQSRKPIDVIKGNRPIMILDEPQKMEGAKTLESLEGFNPLMILRYSATHKTTHNKIHRLDALDAYNQKLVKKISVRGISVKGLSGTNPYLYLGGIEVSISKPPIVRVELEIKQSNGIKRVLRKLSRGDNLFDLSGNLDQYKGFVVADINAHTDTINFTNGVELVVGEATGDVNESALRRIQIREAVKAHFEKEQVLFHQGIKVLSLFFIDEVAKYRRYDESGENPGEYAQIFEEEYNQHIYEVMTLEDTPYNRYLKGIQASKTHNGYFSIDKKTKRLIDPETSKKSTETDDVDAYDLILKDKERLLSFAEPVRFIFSHSALREGWDNPNVFVICALKHSDNTISRRQEVGRGLRISVNQDGDRMDNPATVHQINVLTVVASESYKDFVAALQRDISDSLSARPRIADEEYFTGKVLKTASGDVIVSPKIAKQIYKYLLKNDYTDDSDKITQAYHSAKAEGQLAELPVELLPYTEQIFQLIDSVYSDVQIPDIGDDRKAKTNPLSPNFDKKEFQDLWRRINHKAAYTVHFETPELIKKCITALEKELKVSPLQYTIVTGIQNDTATDTDLKQGESFKVIETTTDSHKNSIHSAVKYDLIGKLAEESNLTRSTIANILHSINVAVFSQYKTNPEDFIAKAARLINEQKATVIVEKLSYNSVSETYDIDIFTQEKPREDFSKAIKVDRHIYDYVFTDSKGESNFVKELDSSAEVVVYAKLPRGFFIPTPVGNYNPDWAIAFKEGSVKHVYFIAETKGSMSSMELREIEKSKIECARKFFTKITSDHVKYDVVDSYGKLMELVK